MKIKTISKFGIIFAVTATMVTTAVFTACSSDDDFGGDITGEYTLAIRAMTRAGENPPITPNEPNGKLIKNSTENITLYPIPIAEIEDESASGYPEFDDEFISNATASATVNYCIYESEEGVYSCSVVSYFNAQPAGFSVTGAVVVSGNKLTDSWDIKFSGMDINCWPYSSKKYWM